MKGVLIAIAATLLCVFFLRLPSQVNNTFDYYRKVFNKAEILFNGNATDSTDSIALQYYSIIQTNLSPSPNTALLLYNCYERSGILKQGFGYTASEILTDYYTALHLRQQYHLSDSILFRLLLSAGNVHYANGVFDSSVYYYSWAEKIINKYPAAGLAGDLYNSLGALYSEAGNYVQSDIYFSKALELTLKTRPDLKEAVFAMSANIASAVRLSGHPDSALYLYKKLLNEKNPSLPIINNIAGIYLTNNQPDSALHYSNLAKNLQGNYAIITHNAMAQAYILKNDTSLAANHLRQASESYKQILPQSKNNAYAATCKYFGDLMMMQQKLSAALAFYQQSIIQYDYKFNDTNVFSNPGNFIGEFASYSLFDALAAKANCFAAMYNQQNNIHYYTSAISTFDSAFALADYIKKSIDNDEARFFLADKVFTTYSSAVDFLLSESSLNEEVLVHALEWISKSRATSLAISLKENTIKKFAGLPDSLLQKEKNIKINISRLKFQLQQSSDSIEQTELLSAINSKELQLQSLNNTFKNYPDYYKQKFAADNLDINNIQENILDDKTAVICYFKGKKNIHSFIIKNKSIHENEIKNDTAFNKNIINFLNTLSTVKAGTSFNKTIAADLYEMLMKPLMKDLNGITSLVVIPDQELINLPFEAFLLPNNKYLIEDFAVTYQLALPFLQKNTMAFSKNNSIAFAPFTHKNNNVNLDVLSSSLKEISGFDKHDQYIYNAATKSKFIKVSGNASAIHLATHAIVDFTEPGDSYIAFYRQSPTDNNYKIFAQELYNLQLPKTQFVFLSACETGTGKLSQSEGALSLSRAFAFAGCPNIITSIWKAEDKSTAYISERFYHYTNKGFSYAKALQQAKKDLLNDDSMSQFHSPQYWSNLIFIGDIQDEKQMSNIWLILVVAALIILIALIFRKRL